MSTRRDKRAEVTFFPPVDRNWVICQQRSSAESDAFVLHFFVFVPLKSVSS